MLTILISLLSTILTPLSNFFSSFFNKESAVEVASISGMASVEKQWWFVALTIPAFAIPYILYTWKTIGWDKVIGPWLGFDSSTDPITDPTLGWVFVVVVTGIFLHGISRK